MGQFLRLDCRWDSCRWRTSRSPNLSSLTGRLCDKTSSVLPLGGILSQCPAKGVGFRRRNIVTVTVGKSSPRLELVGVPVWDRWRRRVGDDDLGFKNVRAIYRVQGIAD